MPWLRRLTKHLPLLALVLLPADPVSVRAQEGPDAAGRPAALEATGPSQAGREVPKTLIELVVAGGPLNIAFMTVLGLFSLVGLAVILERLVNLTARKLTPPRFVAELHELAQRKEDNPEPFRELCERYPSAMAEVLKAGLLRAGRPVPEVEKRSEEHT